MARQYLVSLDVSPPAEAEPLDGIEHSLAVDLELGQVQNNRGRGNLVEELTHEALPQSFSRGWSSHDSRRDTSKFFDKAERASVPLSRLYSTKAAEAEMTSPMKTLDVSRYRLSPFVTTFSTPVTQQ
jgi:hypothetical protein